MGYERDTYYFNSHGKMTGNPSENSVLVVNSVEHDVYGNQTSPRLFLMSKGRRKRFPFLDKSDLTRNARPLKMLLDEAQMTIQLTAT